MPPVGICAGGIGRPISLPRPERFQGTCYRAANWIALGRAQGRGRMDRYHEARGTPKWVYVYPLCRNVRERLATATAPAYCEPAQAWNRP